MKIYVSRDNYTIVDFFTSTTEEVKKRKIFDSNNNLVESIEYNKNHERHGNTLYFLNNILDVLIQYKYNRMNGNCILFLNGKREYILHFENNRIEGIQTIMSKQLNLFIHQDKRILKWEKNQSLSNSCLVCFENTPWRFLCCHQYCCIACIKLYLNQVSRPFCPHCRQPLKSMPEDYDNTCRSADLLHSLPFKIFNLS